jgi:hypothetical protein
MSPPRESRTVNVRPVMLLALAGVLATGACGAADPKPAAAGPGAPTTSAPAKDPKDLLNAAVPGDNTGPVAFTVAGDETVSGVIDASKKTTVFEIGQKIPGEKVSLDMSFLLTESKVWVKMVFSGSGAKAMPAIPKKWMLIDPAKIKGGDFPTGYDGSEPGNSADLVDAATDVKQTSPGHFTGITDISGTDDGDVTDADTLKALGDKAKTLPFEATTDDHGRIASLVIKIPATAKTKAKQFTAKYSGYGTAKSPAAPAAADQQAAPAIVYQFLNG